MNRFDVTRALVVACLKAGRPVIVETNGKRGTVTVRAEAKLSYSVWVRGQEQRLGCYTDHSYGGAGERAAAEHFIALVGEKRALKAAQHAAANRSLVHDVEAELARCPGLPGDDHLNGHASTEAVLSYTRMTWSGHGGRTPQWGFILRFYPKVCEPQDVGLALGGAACIGPSLEQANVVWVSTCIQRDRSADDTVLPAARVATAVSQRVAAAVEGAST